MLGIRQGNLHLCARMHGSPLHGWMHLAGDAWPHLASALLAQVAAIIENMQAKETKMKYMKIGIIFL